MIVDCISDLHGHYPKLEGGDLLIVAGDLTARDTQAELDIFDEWLANQSYKKKIFIAGNHDNILVGEKSQKYNLRIGKKVFERCEYLCDSGTEFEGLNIFGSPWTAQFPGINPHCCAFTVRHFDHTDELLAEYWSQIPEDTDILITHCPEYGMLDEVAGGYTGSISLGERTAHLPNIKLHVVGHIHEGYGRLSLEGIHGNYYEYVNASHVNEHYQPVNKPVRVIL